ncbi:uncharacterized protein LOC114306458 [Camellia sinensis]|uniref:uncharacterized protein LOC114306458 n=1 Tax=Camellia sinensis TaxID=4442 RepID=UPI001036A790|nr:uncharacterized protein LOC114306458 [Camellia sinensis]
MEPLAEEELDGKQMSHSAVAVWLKAAQSRQKSYTDNRRRDLEFQVGHHVFLRNSPWKAVMRFGKKGKLSPRYIGPFKILERIDKTTYHLALPPSLSHIHNVFHVSTLKKYMPDPSHVLDFQPIRLKDDLSYEDEAIDIMDKKDQVLHSKTVPLVKVLWKNHALEEANWEREDDMNIR